MKSSFESNPTREKATIQLMIGHYCRLKHGSAQACPTHCPTHCYAPAQRQAIREVMRFIGPRMVYLGPWEFIRHYLHKESES